MNAVNAGKIFLKSTFIVASISDEKSGNRSNRDVIHSGSVVYSRWIDQVDSKTDGSKHEKRNRLVLSRSS
jgi:hypothetical protein